MYIRHLDLSGHTYYEAVASVASTLGVPEDVFLVRSSGKPFKGIVPSRGGLTHALVAVFLVINPELPSTWRSQDIQYYLNCGVSDKILRARTLRAFGRTYGFVVYVSVYHSADRIQDRFLALAAPFCSHGFAATCLIVNKDVHEHPGYLGRSIVCALYVRTLPWSRSRHFNAPPKTRARVVFLLLALALPALPAHIVIAHVVN
jgi:hypothetical protein